MRNRLGLVLILGALARRPLLWIEAIRVLAATRRRGRPWPSMAYLRWRSLTAYGEVTAIPADDVVAFLAWRRIMRTSSGGGRSQ